MYKAPRSLLSSLFVSPSRTLLIPHCLLRTSATTKLSCLHPRNRFATMAKLNIEVPTLQLKDGPPIPMVRILDLVD